MNLRLQKKKTETSSFLIALLFKKVNLIDEWKNILTHVAQPSNLVRLFDFMNLI